MVYKQIVFKEDFILFPEIIKDLENISIEEFISKDPCINLHFPCVLPTYAFFNDCFKQHIETELPELLTVVASDSLANLFPHTSDGSLVPYGD
jgi:hypothetical protein